MRVFLTGGAGFIGSAVANRLRFREHHDLMVYDNCSTGKPENVDATIALSINDLNDYDQLEEAMYGFRPDVVVHLAAQPAISTSWQHYKHDAMVNVVGTINVIRLCRELGVGRVIFSSTSAVYDDREGVLTEETRLFPNTPYGISKLAAERYVMTLMTENVVLRFGNVYGPRQVPLGENQVIPRMIRHFEQGEAFFIHGDGDQRRDFVFVEDVALAVSKALTGRSGIYNISSGIPTSVNELARLMELIYEVPGYKWEHTKTPDLRRNANMRIQEAYKGLGWKPETLLLDGLKQTVEWWKQKK